jgi:NDP-4-keto-2,6-dideoxyhexose 3-C-methyltransferase
MSKVEKITRCRVCGNTELALVVDLGTQYLTGVFLKEKAPERLTKGPLQLVKCHGENTCGLLQLAHSYDLGEMYGENYGYRSGLNRQMVEHLRTKIAAIHALAEPNAGDLVIDIGANDGTSLGFYPEHLQLVGIDPSGAKFHHYYKKHIELIADFFSASLIKSRFPNKKAKIITSFSMFYDLEAPLDFVRDIAEILDPKDGIWVFEQSYMPFMLERMAFDTICHEHLEYYGLKQIDWILREAGLNIIDVDFNDINGGSFSVTAAHAGSAKPAATAKIDAILNKEDAAGLNTLVPYKKYDADIRTACDALLAFIQKAKAEHKKVAALGASTKGNVLLQYCGFDETDIAAIGEVNADKFGAFAPGTWLPIVPEKDVLAKGYDYLLVLPWHFRDFFVNSPAFKGQRLLFPLPKLEVVSL